jgi:cobaltochelatase CobT
MPLPDRAALQTVTAACLRTLAADATLQVDFGRTRSDAICLPLLPDTYGATDIRALRGACDAAACALRFAPPHDTARSRPSGAPGRVFDLLLAARGEAMGALWLPGMAANLAQYLSTAAGREPQLHVAAFCTFLDKPQPRTMPALPAHAAAGLNELAAVMQDANAFVDRTAALARLLTFWMESEAEEAVTAAVTLEISRANDVCSPDESAQVSDESAETAVRGGEPAHEPESESNMPALPRRLSEGYAVYTRQFDQVVQADKLVTAGELDRLRARLDGELLPYQQWIARLARRLQRHIQARQRREWSLDQDEGQLDPSRLSRVITEVSFDTPFRREQEGRFPETVVTLLVDNSGSMRGRPIAIAALTTDILARTLERCAVKVEVLGFTTVDWNGGAPRADWTRAGSPTNPGRLNALRHIIYKAADTPWKRSRRQLGVLLHDAILKENVDGEALWWAHQRLASRPEPRRVLVVLSDGVPKDESTLQSNARDYLERQLRTVIHWIEQHSRVELLAIGIGHDVSRLYRRATALRDVENLGATLIDSLHGLFDRQ